MVAAHVSVSPTRAPRFDLHLALRLAKGLIAWELLMGLIAITMLVGALPLIIALLVHLPIVGWVGVPPAIYLFSQAQKLPVELLKEAADGGR